LLKKPNTKSPFAGGRKGITESGCAAVRGALRQKKLQELKNKSGSRSAKRSRQRGESKIGRNVSDIWQMIKNLKKSLGRDKSKTFW